MKSVLEWLTAIAVCVVIDLHMQGGSAQIETDIRRITFIFIAAEVVWALWLGVSWLLPETYEYASDKIASAWHKFHKRDS